MKLEAKAESVWEEAREKSDFEMFRPYLEKLLNLKRNLLHIGVMKHINIIHY